jgi:hypothetical protein
MRVSAGKTLHLHLFSDDSSLRARRAAGGCHCCKHWRENRLARRFEPGWRAFSEAVVKCSASPVAPWHHDALSGHEGVREVLVGAKEQRRRNG